MRKFALMSIDDARVEGRAWKERFAALEAQHQAYGRLMDSFCQLAYQKSAEIPDQLSREDPR
ncbi:hypothetical protein [Pseudoduganella rhizocola]|uniref:hypothetical protein n=1 Tax=Pseudoduganella rhizocola TaxID=3382643 RepID=UPI0038B61740